VKLDIRRQSFRLARPFESSHGVLHERETLLVALTDGDGVRGYGEAAPLESYDGVSVQQAHVGLERCRAVLESPSPRGQAQMRSVLDACRSACELPQALAAIDTALWDLAARRQMRPLAHMLNPRARPVAQVPVNAIVSALDRARAAEQAASAAAQGYECVKVKVGVGDDAGRVAAVRAAAGPEMALRLDANGAWSVPEALTALAALSPAGLELVEEPVHGVAALREVRERVPQRIAIDETAAEPGALEAGVADAVCLKIGRCGGITSLLADAARARAAGFEVYVASTLDGPVGIAAALHAAAALAASSPLPPCGLGTLGMFEGLTDPLPVRAGMLALPSGPGLGAGLPPA
jgi:o-succinylbenzoate synthase